jgi:hypothetical protein
MRIRLVVLALLLATPLRAQNSSANDVMTGAVRAYRDLDFDAAATMLRRALAPPLASGLDESGRALALTYLAATEHYRAQPDSALAVFRRLVVLAPRHRPDTLVFPPEITRLYDAVRNSTKVVAVRVPADTEFNVAEGGRLVAWLYPSTPHDVTVAVSGEDGRPRRIVYAGPIRDSLDVHWDGRDSNGAYATAERLWLTVVSPGSREVRVPLRVDVTIPDTLPHPSPLSASDVLPERSRGRTGLRSLGGAALLAAGALALPSLVAPGERASGTRFAVAGALGVSGLVGYLSRPAGTPLPENAAINQTRRDAWRRQVDAVTRENAERLRAGRVHIQSGSAVVLDRGAENP